MGRSGVAIKTGAVKAGKGRGLTGERTQGGSPVALPRVSDKTIGCYKISPAQAEIVVL